MRSHLIVFNIAVAFASIEASALTELTQELPRQQKAVEINVDPTTERELQAPSGEMDWFDPDVEVCLNGVDANGNDVYGNCETSRFPVCTNNERICYNRTNRRDKFWPDRQPHFYIDYKRVLCYPKSWLNDGGCSSCSPGRWCGSEKRCILDNRDYPCWG
mmetsp:Transcript_16755/g.30451  ORF Transcript_16755/g.30451 Transcript_16755/m.30451 type:complete len:160 (-) Transcript_16755:425-904(-)